MRMLAVSCLSFLVAVSSRAGACQFIGAENDVRLKIPVNGMLTTGFGMRRHPILQTVRMHNGTDWSAEPGTPVRASADGEIIKAGRYGEFGNMVVVRHGGGIETAYAHLNRIDVKEGDCVAQSAVIGGVGSTGLASGPQLHFEVRRDGRFLDPIVVLGQSAER